MKQKICIAKDVKGKGLNALDRFEIQIGKDVFCAVQNENNTWNVLCGTYGGDLVLYVKDVSRRKALGIVASQAYLAANE